ncbi:putative tRNA methyltransferase 9B [Pelodytes ibericus]
MEKEASRLERAHVHSVYEKIAPYFNDKRYKAWPKVQEFILAQEAGSLIADIGCGNGKYLHINSQTFKVGCDYCSPLAESARNHGYEIMMCDGLNLPYRTGCFDAVLSIAVIHHFSTKERRIRAIQEISRILKVGGKVMIYVWAMEQKRRKFEKQDILVPWHLEPRSSNELKKSTKPDDRNIPFHEPNSTNGGTLNTHNQTKHCAGERATSDKAVGNLVRYRILSQSLDSGLDANSKCESDIENYQGLLRTFYDYCNQISRSKTGQTFDLSKPSLFLRQLSELFPSSIKNSNCTAFRGTDPLPLLDGSITGQLNITDVIKGYSRTPLPDLGSTEHSNKLPKPNLSTRQKAPEKIRSRTINECEMVVNRDLDAESKDNKCFRYYHIFKKGELAELIESSIPELRVVQSFFDHSNWGIVAEKVGI